jgi:predicted transposase/invertase (TIGR01784 family)
LKSEPRTPYSSSLTNEQKRAIREILRIDPDAILLSPMLDSICKKIFTDDGVKSKAALISLLNSMLMPLGEQALADVFVTNPEIPVGDRREKKTRKDIRVVFRDGEQAVIEMQRRDEHDFPVRAEFLISKTAAGQEIFDSQNYNAIKKCFVIGLINFTLFDHDDTLVSDYRYRDRNGKDHPGARNTIIYVELPKINQLALTKAVCEMSTIERWAFFFRYAPSKRKQIRDMLDQIVQEEEGIGIAMEILTNISSSSEERFQYELDMLEELAYRNEMYRSRQEGMAEGIAKGETKGEAKVIRALLSNGMTVPAVSHLIGISIDEIEKILN